MRARVPARASTSPERKLSGPGGKRAPGRRQGWGIIITAAWCELVPVASDVGGPARDGFAWRVAVFYAAMFGFIGIQLPFFPVWLEAQGLSSGQTAVVLAAPLLVRLIAVPVATRLADHFAIGREALILASVAALGGFVVVGFTREFCPVLLSCALASIVLAPILPLLDAYALQGLPLRGRAFGPVRVWGSAAFVAANLGAGLALDFVAARHLVWLLVAALALAAAASFGLRPLEPSRPRPGRPTPGGSLVWQPRLFASPRVLTVAAGASLIQASHALYYSFSVIDWTQQGLDGSLIGGLWAIGVLAEMALFACSARLPPRVRPLTLVGLGAVAAVLRWSLMASDPPRGLLPLLQCLHGLSFGATFLGSVQIMAHVAGERQVATAQGDFATAAAAAMAAATVLSGLLYSAMGSRGYWAMALIAAMGGGLMVVGRGYACERSGRDAVHGPGTSIHPMNRFDRAVDREP